MGLGGLVRRVRHRMHARRHPSRRFVLVRPSSTRAVAHPIAAARDRPLVVDCSCVTPGSPRTVEHRPPSETQYRSRRPPRYVDSRRTANSEADISLLLGGAPLEATTDAPFPLEGMFARDPDGRLYKSLDGRLLVRLESEPSPRPSWDKQQPVHVVTVYNFAVIAHPTEGMMRCFRAYGVIK